MKTLRPTTRGASPGGRWPETMTDTRDMSNRPGTVRTAAAKVAPDAPSSPAWGKIECDEAEFAVCCFALCDWHTYDIAGGQIHIRAQA